jgi:hypothetical protein
MVLVSAWRVKMPYTVIVTPDDLKNPKARTIVKKYYIVDEDSEEQLVNVLLLPVSQRDVPQLEGGYHYDRAHADDLFNFFGVNDLPFAYLVDGLPCHSNLDFVLTFNDEGKLIRFHIDMRLQVKESNSSDFTGNPDEYLIDEDGS